MHSRNATRVAEGFSAHYVSDRLCDGALIMPSRSLGLPENVYLTSPELSLLLLMRRLSLAAALVVALEACGTYDLAPCIPRDEDDVAMLDDVHAATTPERLRDFALRLPAKTRGGRRFRLVADLAAANSASPMESRLYARLSLPVRHGGYGIAGLQLNPTVSLGPSERSMLGSASMRVDLMDKRGATGIEYDSRYWHEAHADETRIARDKLRIDVARFHGITLLPLTLGIVRDEPMLDEFVRGFARVAHIRLREPSSASLTKRHEGYLQLFRSFSS